MSETKRIKWLDCAKGMAAILVVVGHIASGYLDAGIYVDYGRIMVTLNNIIYSFHMPLFFILSGFSFGFAYIETETQKLCKRKIIVQIGNIIVLYYAWSVILWVFKYIFSAYVNNEYSLNMLLWISLRAFGPYWYLYVLALCYLVTYVLVSRGIDDKYILICSAILCLAQAGIIKMGDFTALKLVSYYFSFFAGLYLSQNEIGMKIIIKRPVILLNLFVGSILGVLFCYTKCEKSGWSAIPLWGSVMAMMICLGVIGVIYRHPPRIFEFVGKSSLEIFLMHVFITAGNRKILPMIGINIFWVNFICNLLMATFIPILIGMLLKKIKIYSILFKPFTCLKNWERTRKIK